jgi:branched-chain amino acid transport system permease protein
MMEARIKPRTLRYAGYLILLVILAVLPKFVPSRYAMRLVNLSMIHIIAAIGLDFSWGMCGQVSLGHAAFYGIGAYTSAILMVDYGFNFWYALPFVVVVSLAFGIFIGIPALRLKTHYLALASIGFQEITYLVMKNWQEFTHGALGIGNIPAVSLGTIVLDNDYRIYYLIAVFLLVAVVIARRIQSSHLGRAMLAIRESEIAANVMGVPTTYIKVFAFALAALFAGVAGALYGSLTGYIGADCFNFAKSVDYLTMILVGGTGSVAGSIVGATLLTILPEWLRFLKLYATAVNAFGIVLILIWKPKGLVGMASDIRQWLITKVSIGRGKTGNLEEARTTTGKPHQDGEV